MRSLYQVVHEYRIRSGIEFKEKMPIKETIKSLEEYLKKVELPWTASANVPFYVNMKKPRPSMSKHDSRCPTYWDYYDGCYALMCANEMPKILEYIKELERMRDEGR